ncbi:MAG: hypothetical protein AAGF91_04575 [Actinomycetota bacterium]
MRGPISRGKRRIPLPLEKAPRKITPTAIRIIVVVFGVAVAGIVYLAFRPQYDPRPITVIETSPEVDGVLVTVTHERCDAEEARASVDESEDVVVVRAEYDTSGTDCDDVGLETELVLTLDEPLGDRGVQVHPDSWTGSVECLSRGEPAPEVCSGP